MTGFIVFLVLVIIAGLGWKAYHEYQKYQDVNVPAPQPTQVFTEPQPLYLSATVRLDLPSAVPAFRFSCEFNVEYRADGTGPGGREPLEVAKSSIQEEARKITAAYTLDGDMGLLRSEVNTMLQKVGKSGRLAQFSAQCVSVDCDSVERDLVKEVSHRKFKLEVENHLEDAYRTRIRQLDELFSEPRKAALWWFAQNPDKIDQLPNKIKLMYRIDRSLHHEGAEGGVSWFDPEHPDGQQATDLSEFLASSDLSSRAAVGTLLGNTYERFGRADLAQRARMLAEVPEPDLDPEPEPEAEPDAGPAAQAEPGTEPEKD